MCIQRAAVDGGPRRLVVLPVAEHHAVAARAQLALDADGHDLARLRIDDLDLDVRVHLPHRAHLLRERRAEPRLGAHRARLRHPVGDGDVAHVHRALDLLHHLHRARRPRHDARAQARQVVAREVGMVQLGDEHRGHAVQRGRPLRLGRLEDGRRIEALARVDHGGPVRHAAEVAHDHAEAVIERHGDEEPVAVREAEELRREVPVVQDIVMAERGALRVAGGAARVLDVDRVVELLLALPPRQVLGAHRRRLRQQLGPGEHAGRARLAEPDHAAQVGQGRRPRAGPGGSSPSSGASSCIMPV